VISYRGKLSALLALPVLGQMSALLNLDGLKAELAGLLQLSVSFTPPSVDGIVKFTLALEAALPSFTPPTVNFSADILAKIGLLQAKIELILQIANLLASGSLR
jgi:hypothetical protein